MNKKNFIVVVFIFTFAIGIVFLLGNFFYYKVPKTTLWIQNCFIKKENYALSINEKKIVFTSGSNTLYGVETKLIEDVLEVPTVNMAIHAGLKTDYILYRTKNILKDGDIVILPLEYQNYLWDGEEEETRTDYILTHDKRYFLSELTFYEQLSLLSSKKPFDLLKSIKESFSELKEQEIGKGYTSITLNKNGDETYKNGFLAKKYSPFELKNFKETKGLKKILEFSKWCKLKNIKLFVTFPNTINHKEYNDKAYTEYFANLVKYFEKNNIKMIGKPIDFLFPMSYFYNTNYHMNSNGAKIRTMSLLKIISNQHFNDFGILVTKDTIDQHLANLRNQIKAYDVNSSLNRR